MTTETHEPRYIGKTSQVGPTYQRAGKRTLFYGYCSCGAGTTNSTSTESVRRKLANHAVGDNRGMFNEVARDPS